MKTKSIFKKLFVLPLFALLLAIGACSSGTAEFLEKGSQPIGNVPKFLLQTASNGTLRADLDVYGPDGTLIYSEALQLNQESSEVFSSQFRLDRGFTYSFLITFYYTKQGVPEVPLAFVAKVATTEGEFLTVLWEAPEVLIALNQLNPDISASFSTTNYPDLDSDDDGYSNFIELVEDSNPMDKNSIPAAPALAETNIPVKSDFIELHLTFTDASGISSIKPVGDYLCGYYEWTIENLDSEGLSKRLHAKFNLHARGDIADGSSVPFQFKVTDALGLGITHTVTVEGVTKNSSYDETLKKPAIWIASPLDGESVSDFVTIEAEACHEDDIDFFQLEIFSPSFDQDSSEEKIQGSLPTTEMADNQLLTFQARTKQTAESFTKSVTVKVDSQNPIKIDSPTPGSILQDGFTLVAHVDKNLMPDVTQFYIERITQKGTDSEVFELNQLKFDVNSLPEAFTGQIFSTANVLVSDFTVHFVAIGPQTGRKDLPVDYSIDNKPIIDKFEILNGGPAVCIVDGQIELEWKVSGLGSDFELGIAEILIEDNPSFTSGTTTFEQPGSPFSGNTEPPCEAEVTLQATRNTVDQSSGSTISISADPVTITLTPVTITATYDEDTRVKPSDELFTINPIPTGVIWSIEVTDLKTQAKHYPNPPNLSSLTGDAAGLDLDPFSEYEIRFHILDGQDNPERISTSQVYTVKTDHDRLVGWWTMDNEFGLGLDSSEFSHHGNSNGFMFGTNSDCLLSECAPFDGNDDFIDISDTPELNPVSQNGAESFTIEAWVKWNEDPDKPVGNNEVAPGPVIVKKGQYEIRVFQDPPLKTLQFVIHKDSNTEHIVEYDAINNLNPNQWYHVVGAYRRKVGFASTAQNLYIDGVNVASNSSSAPTIIQDPASTSLLFGTDDITSPSGLFLGFLDEVRIYESILTQDMIVKRCEITSGGNCP